MSVARALLLDFYGTLVWEDDHIIAAICDELLPTARDGVTQSGIARIWWDHVSRIMRDSHDDTFLPQRETARRSLVATLAEIGSHADPEPLLARQFAHWVAPGVFPEAAEFLAALGERDITVCVVSNIDRRDVLCAMIHTGCRVGHLVTSDDVQSYKPRPEMFRRALDTLGLEPSEVIHVGDSRTSDVAGATNLGIPVVWINRTGKKITSGPLPTWTVDNLLDILNLT